MTDAEFVAELRRHLIAIIKAVFKRFGVDLFKSILPSPIQATENISTESPDYSAHSEQPNNREK
jgi:hypothetical protein